jgi:16S rRNA (guanine966-N2)-methyltransferase
MNVRVISGKYGGRILDAPGRNTTHAMSERIRNAMFNTIGSEIEDARVLDAFAGSGSIGIEALSRGASFVTFVERDRVAAKIIAKNCEMLGADEESEVIKTTVNNWLESANPELYDVIFADPPYHDEQFSTVKKLFGLLKPNGLMVLSHTGKGETSVQNGIVVVDNRSYGNARLTYFRKRKGV